MRHITKEKGGFRVTHVADNGKVLNQTEALSTKNKCFVNVRSVMKDDCLKSVQLQDDTRVPAVLWLVTADLTELSARPPKPRYVPRRNKK